MRTIHLSTLKIFIFISIIQCFTNTLLATNYYVSNDGSDSNNGTTLTSPLLTIQAALNIAAAGDIIYIREGTYAEKLWWANSGSSGNPITLTNYNSENVVISGVSASNATQGAAILISSQSYIRINGLIFRDNIMNYADGVYVTGSGTDIQITNCEFDNIGWTSSKTTFPTSSDSAHAIIFVGTTSTSISNVFIGVNYIHDCITGYSESITIAGNVEDFLIEGNTLDSNTNIGIDAAGHFTWTGAPDDVNYSRNGIIRNNIVSNYDGPEDLDAAGGIYTDGGSYITIENNTVYNYKVGFSVGCEVPGNSNTGNIVRNNLAYNCSLSGLFLGSNTTSDVINTQVYNNTFYKCGAGTFDNGQIALQNNTNSDIRNNILYPTNGRFAMVQMGGTTSSGTTLNYNMFWRDNAITTDLLYDITGNTNSVIADPQFTDAISEDFHISSSSPAVNAGDPTYSPNTDVFDIDGQARVLNDRVDIGVDESGDTTTTDSLTASYLSEFDADGGSQNITVSANISWTVSESASWISVNTNSGSNNGSVSVTVTENTDTSSRFATITIAGSSISRAITLSQEGAEIIIVDTPSDNLAIDGTASQSSTAYNSEASRAIDENINGSYSGGSVTHTSPTTGSWWQVELNAQTNIGNIVIYNRTDSCCIDRLSDFTVTIYDNNDTEVFSQTITEAPTPSVTINADGVLGNRVRILNNLTNTPLSLAEVEVYAGEVTDTPTTSCTSGINLSLNGTIADFSTEQNSTNTVGNLIDDNDNNRWSAQTFPQYATVDLGDEYAINEINLVTLNNRDYQFTIEGSTDSATSGFSTIVDATDNTDEGTINRTFSSQTARYVKLTITGANSYTGEWASINSFEIICAGTTSSKQDVTKEIIDTETEAYPNPFINTINIITGTNDPIIIRLVDIVGHTIKEEIINTNTSINNLENLAQGIYFLQTINTVTKTLKTQKFIKN